jgi:hypothetical protein
VDGDGHLDIFCGEMGHWSPPGRPPDNPEARTWIFYGDGTGRFSTQLVAAGQGTHEGRLGDLDGDGRPDILGKPFRHRTPRLDAYLNAGAMSSGTPLPLDRWRRHVVDAERPRLAVFVTAGDLDGDGRADIAAGAWWYRNPGTPGSRWTRRAFGGGLNNVAALHDFDGDGELDVLGTRGRGAEPSSAFVWGRNDGRGRFGLRSAFELDAGDFLQGVAIARWDADALGVALSWHQGSTATWLALVPREPAGRWPTRLLSHETQHEQLSAADIDRDGDVDLLLGTRWLRNDGDGWSVHAITGSPGRPDRNRLVDVDGDGRLDAVVGFEAINQPGRLVWYAQPAAATEPWTEHLIAVVTGPMSLDVGDLDGDGDADVVVGEHDYARPEAARLLIFENLDGRGGTWRQHLVSAGDEHHDGAQLVDIDGDGDLDIISIGWRHPRVLLYENRAR